MPHVYGVAFAGTLTTGGARDLLLAQPADDKPIRLVGWEFGQITELQDAEEYQIDLEVRHFAATVTAGSGGSSVTPHYIPRPGALSAGFTARCGDTTVATTSGTNTLHRPMSWNVRSTPWEKWIPDELRVTALQGEALLVKSLTNLPRNLDIRLVFFVEELI